MQELIKYTQKKLRIMDLEIRIQIQETKILILPEFKVYKSFNKKYKESMKKIWKKEMLNILINRNNQKEDNKIMELKQTWLIIFKLDNVYYIVPNLHKRK